MYAVIILPRAMAIHVASSFNWNGINSNHTVDSILLFMLSMRKQHLHSFRLDVMITIIITHFGISKHIRAVYIVKNMKY